jgi:hypothetical protein
MKLGCDPEVLLYDPVRKRFVSAIGLLGGSKDHPRQVRNGAVQEDNVMAEFNIEPASTREEFVSRVTAMRQELEEMVAPLTITQHASAMYDEVALSNPKAQELGCDPDMNAWEQMENVPPFGLVQSPYRCAGGHVHVGLEIDNEDQVNIARCMDVALGVPALLLDDDRTRRHFYGKAGAYRPKPYGLEYRALSNFWIFDSPLITWVWDSMLFILDDLLQRMDEVNEDRGAIEQAMNNLDYEVARTLIAKYNVEVPA